MLTTTSRAVTGATTRYQAPRRSGRSTAVFNLAHCASPSGLFGGPARDTKSRLDERFHGRELVAAGLLQHGPGVVLRGADGDGEILVSQSHGLGLNNAHSIRPGKRGSRQD